MTLVQILILTFAAVCMRWIIPANWQGMALLWSSLIAVAWIFADTMPSIQAAIFYVFTLGITMLVWVIVGESDENLRYTLAKYAFVGWIMAVGILAYGGELTDFTLLTVSLTGLLIFSMSMFFYQLRSAAELQIPMTVFMICLFILAFVILKLPTTARFFADLQIWNGGLFQSSGIVWIGFSYFAFRLLALLLDVQAGRFSPQGFNLRDTMTYVLFFPSYTAGPIDRGQRFISELIDENPLDANRLVIGLGRIFVGGVKKFVIADTLALVSVNTGLVESTESTLGLWFLVYAYAFQIYFDFSGYSDVAIGLGILLGVKLPENFNQPYLRPNIQQFWQNWHITLSSWFRVYFFVPFTRFMLQRRYKPPHLLIVLSAQISTMVLIGVWHGISVNFVIWGLWHSIGLFAFKVISDNTRLWHRRLTENTRNRRIAYGLSLFVTFHFVVLGWIFFALPDVNVGFRLLIRLIGFGAV